MEVQKITVKYYFGQYHGQVTLKGKSTLSNETIIDLIVENISKAHGEHITHLKPTYFIIKRSKMDMQSLLQILCS